MADPRGEEIRIFYPNEKAWSKTMMLSPSPKLSIFSPAPFKFISRVLVLQLNQSTSNRASQLQCEYWSLV
ncbi:MAG: hypothetical protein AAGC43_18380, partial [Bacteroidota bacterium]